ncbi:MAG: hypothetical protein U0835_26885 [Isosphaeraceae bacterium]
MGRLSETSPEAQAVLTEAYRRLSPARKLKILEDEFRLARRLFLEGERRRNPASSPPALANAWRTSLLGRSFPGGVPMESPQGPELEPVAVLRTVTAALDSLGIAYAVGGSWASGLYGEPRMTRDADVSVEPFRGRERALAACFGPDFYVSVPAMEQANLDRSKFNIIDPPAAYKVDVFVVPDDGFSRSLMARRTQAVSGEPAETGMTWVSAEDIVLLVGNGLKAHHYFGRSRD